MSDIRRRFEEIWPVPDGVFWSEKCGYYFCDQSDYNMDMAKYNGRLDTFTRCQESMGPVLSLVDEMIVEIEGLCDCLGDLGYDSASEILARAKQVLGR